MAESIFGQKKPEFPFERTPIVGKHMKELALSANNLIVKEGLSKSIMDVLKQKGSRIESQYDTPAAKKYLHQVGKPLIVAFTHASLAEPLAIIASMSNSDWAVRDDIRVMVADGWPQYPNLNSYFLPLYNTAPKSLLRPDRGIFKIFGGRALDIDRQKALELNKSSLKIAASELKDGRLILISPEGNLPKKSPWSAAGIGRLISEIGEGSGGHLIFANVKGADMIECIKLMSPLSGPEPFQHTIVRFSGPLDIDEFAKMNKTIATNTLNQKYNEWIKSA